MFLETFDFKTSDSRVKNKAIDTGISIITNPLSAVDVTFNARNSFGSYGTTRNADGISNFYYLHLYLAQNKKSCELISVNANTLGRSARALNLLTLYNNSRAKHHLIACCDLIVLAS